MSKKKRIEMLEFQLGLLVNLVSLNTENIINTGKVLSNHIKSDTE
jgi:hypothetical protein